MEQQQGRQHEQHILQNAGVVPSIGASNQQAAPLTQEHGIFASQSGLLHSTPQVGRQASLNSHSSHTDAHSLHPVTALDVEPPTATPAGALESLHAALDSSLSSNLPDDLLLSLSAPSSGPSDDKSSGPSSTDPTGGGQGYKDLWQRVSRAAQGEPPLFARDVLVQGMVQGIKTLGPSQHSSTVLQANVAQLDSKAVASVMKALGKGKGKLKNRAFEVFDWLHMHPDPQYSSLCDVYVYTTMVSCCNTPRLLWKALQLVGLMKSKGIECNTYTYSALMNVCIKARQPSLAIEVYQDMITAGCVPSEVTYHTLLLACANTGKGEVAVAALERMLGEGKQPEARVLESVIREYCTQMQPQVGHQLAKVAVDAGVRLPETAYIAIISAYCRKQQPMEALEVLDLQVAGGVPCSAQSYAPLLLLLEGHPSGSALLGPLLLRIQQDGIRVEQVRAAAAASQRHKPGHSSAGVAPRNTAPPPPLLPCPDAEPLTVGMGQAGAGFTGPGGVAGLPRGLQMGPVDPGTSRVQQGPVGPSHVTPELSSASLDHGGAGGYGWGGAIGSTASSSGYQGALQGARQFHPGPGLQEGPRGGPVYRYGQGSSPGHRGAPRRGRGSPVVPHRSPQPQQQPMRGPQMAAASPPFWARGWQLQQPYIRAATPPMERQPGTYLDTSNVALGMARQQPLPNPSLHQQLPTHDLPYMGNNANHPLLSQYASAAQFAMAPDLQALNMGASAQNPLQPGGGALERPSNQDSLNMTLAWLHEAGLLLPGNVPGAYDGNLDGPPPPRN